MEVEMLNETHAARTTDAPPASPARPAAGCTHPDDVLEDRTLTLAEKREILAGWVSDANAVPDRP